jgi:hypothetical protein
MAISQAGRLALHACYVAARQWFSPLSSIGTSVALGEAWRETPIFVKEKNDDQNSTYQLRTINREGEGIARRRQN